jgi:hypothetical protein
MIFLPTFLNVVGLLSKILQTNLIFNLTFFLSEKEKESQRATIKYLTEAKFSLDEEVRKKLSFFFQIPRFQKKVHFLPRCQSYKFKIM